MVSIKSIFLRGVLLAGVAGMAAGSVMSAQAQMPPGQYARPNGYPITNVNLRAGPGTYYPVIVVVPINTPISIQGCLGDYTWCDVVFQGNRGWMRSIYLKKWYQGYYYALGDYAPRLGISVVNFEIGSYWDSNYRDRPFYRDRGRWGGSYGEGWTNRGVFYDRLAPYGNWIWLQGQYVWVPSNVGPYWRPYTMGRWVYTDRYGWMWMSNEPFGWATYHYGRWGFSNRIGWFWVPGSRWAPAWVSWRQSNDYLAWAPLPPTPDEGLGISITVGTIPDYYWQAVPSQAFLSVDLSKNIIRDRDRFQPVLQQTQPIGNVTVVNNTTIVNNVVNLTYVEQKTKEKVVVHKVEKTKDQKNAGKIEGAAIEVFQPAADQAPATVAPPAAKPIEEVAKESKTKVQAEGAPSTEDLLVPTEIKKLPASQGTSASGEGKKEGTAESGEAQTPPPPPAPPAEGTPATEEAAPPPPPPPPPPAEEAAPQAAPATEQASPPPPVTEEAAPPPAPPPPAEEAAPPAAPSTEEAPVAQPGETPQPKKQKDQKPKKQQEQMLPGEPQQESPPAPPAPPAPPPQEETAPEALPQAGAPAPMMKQDGSGKPKKEKSWQAQPGEMPPSFAPPGTAGQTGSQPPSGDAPPQWKQGGKQGKAKKAPGEAPGAPCPEGMAPAEDGSCAPAE